MGGLGRFYVSIDAEGLPYVPYKRMLGPGDPLYQELRRIMTWIVEVVAGELYSAGADEVVVADSHGAMVNVDPLALGQPVTLVRGFPRPLSMIYGSPGSRGALLIGYHGSPQSGGVLGHTYAGRIVQRVGVDGFEAASELVLNTYALGEQGVPVILVAGDSVLEEDASRVAPHAVFVPLKSPASSSLADVSPPRMRVEEALRAGVRRALEGLEGARPVKPRDPRITVEFKRPWHADLASLFPCTERLDGVTVRLTCDNYLDNYKLFEGLVIAAYSLERQ